MRPWIGHPDYVYTPWSEERRERMRLVHRRRLGIPDGMARLCGIHVPIAHADAVRHDAYWIKYNVGEQEAVEFIRKVAGIDWDLIGELLHENTTYREIAQFYGIPWWYVEKKTARFRRISRKVIKCRNDDTGLWNEISA